MKKVFLLLLVLTLSACTNTVHRSTVTKQDFKTNHKKVVLSRLGLPEGLRHRDDVRDFYLQALQTTLVRNGFEVVEPDIYHTVFDRIREELGGYYDPKSGELDNEKFELIKRNALKELKETHNVDVVVYHDIRVRTASFGQYRATWDGQTEAYEKNNSDMVNFLSSMVQQTSGRLPALSYLIFVEDLMLNELYMGAGGIQLLSKLNDSNKFEDLPASVLLQEHSLMSFSVNEALRKLVDVSAQ